MVSHKQIYLRLQLFNQPLIMSASSDDHLLRPCPGCLPCQNVAIIIQYSALIQSQSCQVTMYQPCTNHLSKHSSGIACVSNKVLSHAVILHYTSSRLHTPQKTFVQCQIAPQFTPSSFFILRTYKEFHNLYHNRKQHQNAVMILQCNNKNSMFHKSDTSTMHRGIPYCTLVIIVTQVVMQLVPQPRVQNMYTQWGNALNMQSRTLQLSLTTRAIHQAAYNTGKAVAAYSVRKQENRQIQATVPKWATEQDPEGT